MRNISFTLQGNVLVIVLKGNLTCASFLFPQNVFGNMFVFILQQNLACARFFSPTMLCVCVCARRKSITHYISFVLQWCFWQYACLGIEVNIICSMFLSSYNIVMCLCLREKEIQHVLDFIHFAMLLLVTYLCLRWKYKQHVRSNSPCYIVI